MNNSPMKREVCGLEYDVLPTPTDGQGQALILTATAVAVFIIYRSL